MTGGSLADLDTRHVWRGTLIAGLLNGAFMPFDLVVGSEVPGMPWWPTLLSSAVGWTIVGFVIGVHWRRPQTVRLGSLLFVGNTAVVLFALWVSASYHVHNPLLGPFQGHKLGTLTVALLAPGRRIGMLCIGAYSLLPLVQIALFDPRAQGRTGVGEAITLLVFGACGAVLLLYRLRSLATERALVRAHTETADARRSARLLLAVRDLSNSPLQVIALASATLRARRPELGEQIDRIDRALDRLRALHRPLKIYEADLEWRPGDESFDPEAVLALAEEHARVRRSTPA